MNIHKMAHQPFSTSSVYKTISLQATFWFSIASIASAYVEQACAMHSPHRSQWNMQSKQNQKWLSKFFNGSYVCQKRMSHHRDIAKNFWNRSSLLWSIAEDLLPDGFLFLFERMKKSSVSSTYEICPIILHETFNILFIRRT